MFRFVLIAFILFLTACCSSSKKSGTNIFVEDSEFLRQGRKIEIYREKKANPPAKVDKEDRKLKVVSKKEVESQKKNVQEEVLEVKAEKPSKIVKEELSKKVKSFPFKVGEEVVLSASFFGVEAGKVYLGVDNFMLLDGKKQYNFYAVGKTTSVFSLFYKVKNKIESLWDPEIELPKTIAFDAKETKQKYKARAYFDWDKKKAEYFEEGWDKKKGEYRKQKAWSLKTKGHDIVSAIFYARTLPLKVGEEYKVIVFEEDKVIEATLFVDRKEVLNTRVGKIKTLVLKPSFKTKGKFKKVGDISIWLSDDSYRQVVRVESKIRIGTVVASLHSIKRPDSK